MFWFKRKQLVNNDTDAFFNNEISFEEIKAHLIETYFLKNNLKIKSVNIEKYDKLSFDCKKRTTYCILINIVNHKINFHFDIGFNLENKKFNGRFYVDKLQCNGFSLKIVSWFTIVKLVGKLQLIPDGELPFIKPFRIISQACDKNKEARTKYLYSMGLKPKNKHIKAIRKAK